MTTLHCLDFQPLHKFYITKTTFPILSADMLCEGLPFPSPLQQIIQCVQQIPYFSSSLSLDMMVVANYYNYGILKIITKFRGPFTW